MRGAHCSSQGVSNGRSWGLPARTRPLEPCSGSSKRPRASTRTLLHGREPGQRRSASCKHVASTLAVHARTTGRSLRVAAGRRRKPSDTSTPHVRDGGLRRLSIVRFRLPISSSDFVFRFRTTTSLRTVFPLTYAFETIPCVEDLQGHRTLISSSTPPACRRAP